jgi:hypothetical protein
MALPKVFHTFDRSLGKRPLGCNSLEKLSWIARKIFLVRCQLVKFDGLKNGILLLFANVQPAGICLNILRNIEWFSICKLSWFDTLSNETWRVNFSGKVFSKTSLYTIRLNLIGIALTLLDHHTPIAPNFFLEIIIRRTSWYIKSYNRVNNKQFTHRNFSYQRKRYCEDLRVLSLLLFSWCFLSLQNIFNLCVLFWLRSAVFHV